MGITTSTQCTPYNPTTANFVYNPVIINPQPLFDRIEVSPSGATGVVGTAFYDYHFYSSSLPTMPLLTLSMVFTNGILTSYSLKGIINTDDYTWNLDEQFFTFRVTNAPLRLLVGALQSISADVGDVYNIILSFCNFNLPPALPQYPKFSSAKITLTRHKNVTVGAGGGFGSDFINLGLTGGCSGCACFTNNSCGNVRVPIVTISGQTTFDGEYLADMLFTICDEQQYYKCKKIKSCCGVYFIKPELVLQTQFRTCGIELEKVVKGVGSLRNKLVTIYNQFTSILGGSFNAFYENFILYAMAKYILSKILYGDFNLDYLLKSFNKQFLEDLSNSRFCGFLTIFEDCNSPIYGFNKFFKSGNKHYSESSVVIRKRGCGCK